MIRTTHNKALTYLFHPLLMLYVFVLATAISARSVEARCSLPEPELSEWPAHTGEFVAQVCVEWEHCDKACNAKLVEILNARWGGGHFQALERNEKTHTASQCNFPNSFDFSFWLISRTADDNTFYFY